MYYCTIIFESNYIHGKSIFAAIITIFNGLFDIVVIVGKYFVDCVVSIAIQNCYSSYYKFIYCYSFVFIHSPMTLLSFNQLELMICGIISVLQSNCRYKNNVHGQNKPPIEGSIEPYGCMWCTSMNYNVMLIINIHVICAIHLCSYFMDMYVLYH